MSDKVELIEVEDDVARGIRLWAALLGISEEEMVARVWAEYMAERKEPQP